MANPFYSSKDWHKRRSQTLKRDGYRCRMCNKDVRGKHQAHVDHIIKRKEAPHLALELSNLQTLCTHCHNSTKKRDELNPHRGCNELGLPNDGSWD